MWKILDNWKTNILNEYYRYRKIDKTDFKKFKFAQKQLLKVIDSEESNWENALIDIAEKRG